MKDQFALLISKVLAGEANDNEKKSFKEMLMESNQQYLLYSQIKEYWDSKVYLTRKSDNENFETKLIALLL